MSYDAWNESEGDAHERCRTDEHVAESFVTGAQAMREMLARFVEQGGDHSTAASIRANWNPEWGPDPGYPGRLGSTLRRPGDDPPEPVKHSDPLKVCPPDCPECAAFILRGY